MDSREITATVNNIASSVNSELNDFYESLRNDVALKNAKMQSVKDSSRRVKACPVLNEIPKMTETERQIAMSVTKNIEKVVVDNRNDFEGVDVSETSYTGGSKDSGGNEGTETVIINVGIPQWILDIKQSVKSAFKRVKRREWFDEEGLVRGLTRKKKEHGMKRIEYVYFVLDVSGSMSWTKFRGVDLIIWFASYIPSVAKMYSGRYVQVDGDKVIDNDLKKLSKADIKTIILGGGSGADFAMANEWIKNDIITRKVTHPVIVIATDNDEDFHYELLPNTIFITTDKGWDEYAERSGLIEQGFPNPLKGQKVIIIDVD